MVSLTKEGIRERLAWLSKETMSKHPDIHKLCVKGLEALSKEGDISKIVCESNIAHPFVLALGVISKVPLYVLDVIRLFLCYSLVERSYFPKICETLTARQWYEESKLKILQFVLYLVGDECVNGDILSKLFFCVVGMKDSTNNHVALSSEVISKQMILVVFDRYLNDVKKRQSDNAPEGEASDRLTQKSAGRHKDDAMHLFEAIKSLASNEKQTSKKAGAGYYLDILDIAVDNALAIESVCEKASLSEASGHDDTNKTHAQVLDIARRNMTGDLAKISLQILLRYVRHQKYRREISACVADYLSSKSRDEVFCLRFLQTLSSDECAYFEGIQSQMINSVLAGTGMTSERLSVCKKICTELYSREITPIENKENFERSTENTHFIEFADAFRTFVKRIPPKEKALVGVEIPKMLLRGASIHDHRDIYEFYLKEIRVASEDECLKSAAQTAEYVQTSWGVIINDLSNQGWRLLTGISTEFSNTQLDHVFAALAELNDYKHLVRLVEIYQANVRRLISHGSVDVLETCFKAVVKAGTCDLVSILVLEYYRNIEYVDLESAGNGSPLPERMESFPLVYLVMFLKVNRSHCEILDIMLEVVRIGEDRLQHSWGIIFDILGVCIDAGQAGEPVHSLSLKNFKLMQWIVEENIHVIHIEYIFKTLVLLRKILTTDINITLNVLNLYQDIGDFLFAKDVNLLKPYFTNVLTFLDDSRFEVVETVLSQVFNIMKCYEGSKAMDTFIEKEVLMTTFRSMERFGLFFSQPYFARDAGNSVLSSDLVCAGDAEIDCRGADYTLIHKNLGIFFMTMKHINAYMANHDLPHFVGLYTEFIGTSLKTKIKIDGVASEDLKRWMEVFSGLCIDALRILFCVSDIDSEEALSPRADCATYVDVCLNIPLSYYDEHTCINLLSLYYNMNMPLALVEKFCDALNRILLNETGTTPLCYQTFTLCSHILAHSHYEKVITLYTTLLNSQVFLFALESLVVSYNNQKSSAELYKKVVLAIYACNDWERGVDAVKTVSRELSGIRKFRAFLDVSRKILFRENSRHQEKVLMIYLDVYKEIVRDFWKGMKANLDNEEYYKENGFGDFESARSRLLSDVFRTQPSDSSPVPDQIPSVAPPSNTVACVECLREAYLVVCDLAILKEQSFKEHLAIHSYNILFEDMQSLKIVYDMLKQRMKYRLAEFSKEEKTYGMLYPRIRKEEIYVILGMLVKSNDKHMMKFMLEELLECLGCRDGAVIKGIQSCLKAVHSNAPALP